MERSSFHDRTLSRARIRTFNGASSRASLLMRSAALVCFVGSRLKQSRDMSARQRRHSMCCFACLNVIIRYDLGQESSQRHATLLHHIGSWHPQHLANQSRRVLKYRQRSANPLIVRSLFQRLIRTMTILYPCHHRVRPSQRMKTRKKSSKGCFVFLDRAEAESFNHIVSWQPHGRCFVIHHRRNFKGLLSVLMPGMTRWKSFQRQLCLWGFAQLTSGRDINGYNHEVQTKSATPHATAWQQKRPQRPC
jgi:HSF-type DNA-binding